MKKFSIIFKWLCPTKKRCIEDVSRAYFGSEPKLNESIYYLSMDEGGNDSYVLLPDGEYTCNNHKLIIKNEIVTTYELDKGNTKG